jgi:hypothetical protein
MDGFSFKRVGSLSLLSTDEIKLNNLSEMVCFAPLCEIWKALGVESQGETFKLETPIGNIIIESLAKAGAAGRLIPELVDDINKSYQSTPLELGNNFDDPENNEETINPKPLKRARKSADSSTSSQVVTTLTVHPHIDRVVSSGTIVKRSLIFRPSESKKALSAPVRVRSNAAILHLKRFASEYRPNDEGMEFSAGEEIKEIICEYIVRVLESNNVTALPFSDLAKYLAVPNKVIRHLRNELLTQQRESSVGTKQASSNLSATSRLRVFQTICQPTTTLGELSSARKAWYVEHFFHITVVRS